jgi:hypothetical protein
VIVLRMAHSAHATHAAMKHGTVTLCGVSTRGMVPAAGPVVCRWCRNALDDLAATAGDTMPATAGAVGVDRGRVDR